jgi:SAM-dependent methyltransferase
MLDYYRRRADSYERIYAKPERQADLRAIEASLPAVLAGRDVLEVACGTCWWTAHAARDAKRWLATDLNPEAMEIARRKALPACVELAAVDAWTLAEIDADRRFDGAFHGFWWSHVPRGRLAGWHDTLHARLLPGARVVALDNRYVDGSSTPIARRDAAGDTWQQRTLDDGTRHEVLKNFPTRDEAIAALGPRACAAEWIEHAHYWVLSYTLS